MINEALLKALEQLPEDESLPDKDQLQKELSDLTTRFARIVKISDNRKKDIEAIEPLVKEYEETAFKVQSVNEEIEKVLPQRQKSIDLQSLETDLKVVKVTVLFNYISNLLYIVFVLRLQGMLYHELEVLYLKYTIFFKL